MTGFGPYPKLDLTRHNLSVVMIRTEFRVQKELRGILGEKSSLVLLSQTFQYSRRKMPHLITEFVMSHPTEADQFTGTAVYRHENSVRFRTNPPAYRAIPDVNPFIIGVIDVTADVEFRFVEESAQGSRLAMAFPLFADSNATYTTQPADPPFSTIWEINGVKAAPDTGEFEYFLAVEYDGEGFDVHIGFYLESSLTPVEQTDVAINRGLEIVSRF